MPLLLLHLCSRMAAVMRLVCGQVGAALRELHLDLEPPQRSALDRRLQRARVPRQEHLCGEALPRTAWPLQAPGNPMAGFHAADHQRARACRSPRACSNWKCYICWWR